MRLITLIIYVPNNQFFYEPNNLNNKDFDPNNYILRFPYNDPNEIGDENNSDNTSPSVNQNQEHILD